MAPPYDPENSFKDALLTEVRALTEVHGAKKALAEYLRVHPNRLTEYFSVPPLRRPNGEMTLQLQAWAKEKNNAGQ